MCWGNWKEKKKKKIKASIEFLLKYLSFFLKESVYILAITLLGLLLPLSFLLLFRLSNFEAHIEYHLQLKYSYFDLPMSHHPFDQYPSFIFNFFLHINPCILYLFVSIFIVATLLRGVMSNRPAIQPRPYISWILVSTLQVCVGLGVEGSIAAGMFDESVKDLLLQDDSGFGGTISPLSSMVFVFGLHETMRHWCRTVVKLAVDATVFGFERGEGWVERVSGTASLGLLWWWRLREEAECLVVGMVREDGGLVDIGGRWLYYLTVIVGMVRIVNGLMWMAMVLICSRRSDEPREICNDNKV